MAVIREEVPRDVGAVRELLQAAFPTPDEATLVDALRLSGRLTVSLVAVEGDEVVGHIAFSPVTVASSSGGLGLAPLAVLPDRQRRGIGSRLVEDGLAACRSLGVPFVVVLGDPNYYARFGFTPALRFGLGDEYGGGEAFQVLELVPKGIPADAGLVRYAPEFGIFSGDHPA